MKIPELTLFACIDVVVASPQEVGATQNGQRRVIPIIGGTVSGSDWSGTVLAGGADFQRIVTPRLAELDARYVLQIDGELIYVQNRAIRVADPAVTQKLIRGEKVDPALVYFRCTPVLETASERFAWVNERIFVGVGERKPNSVHLTFYVVD